MKKKKNVKKAKKQAKKKAPVPMARVQINVRNLPAVIPTTKDLIEPIRDGKSLTIPKTWLSEKQITRMVEKTPAQYVYKRPGKGGGQWNYVTVGYVQRVLDYCFGFNWDFQIIEHGKEQDHVWVRGRLTVKSPDGKYNITKEQFGRSEVKFKTEMANGKKVQTDKALDYGNDLKAASSDALKKCASMLGIARDIYSKADYKAESGHEPRESRPAPVQEPEGSHETKVLLCLGPKGSGCGYGTEEIDEATYNYSMKRFKKPLCRNCQKDM